MNTTPDLNRIGSVVLSWQRSVVTMEEAQRLINSAMDPVNHLPAAEMVPLPQADESMRQMLAVVERVEQKMNLVIQHNDIPLPNALNPAVLSPEVKELADENRKIEAVARHRFNTGAALADTCEIINRYLREHRGFR